MYPTYSVPLRGLSRSNAKQCRLARAREPVLRVVRWLALRLRARRDRRHLAEMDNRLLADIGIARGDIRVAIGDPRWLPASRR